MRTLAEIFIVGVLIYFGWETPLKTGRMTPSPDLAEPTTVIPQVSSSRPTPIPHPRIVPGIQGLETPTPHGAWRLDPNHRSPLDPPRNSPSPY
jgi:hypothetical protein